MDYLSDMYYYPMPSQGNVYTLIELPVNNGFSQVLFSSLKREIFLFELQKSPHGLIPTVKEVLFTYIPNGSEIISMCAFNKSKTKNNFVIGICLTKNKPELPSGETFLNIYADWDETENFKIENTAQNCVIIELAFAPYHLLHTYLIIWEKDEIKSRENVFLLAGGDNQVHVYREYPEEHLYKECDFKETFPELTKTGSPIQKISVYYSDDFEMRVTAVCCESGYVRVSRVNTKTNKIEFVYSTRFDNYTSAVKLYPVYIYPKSMTERDRFDDVMKGKNRGKLRLNMVVVNTLLPSVVFEDILENALTNYSCLPRLDDESNVLTDVTCTDIDFDGDREILIGSCNRSVTMYKPDHKGEWFLENIRFVPSPVITQLYCDINGDGVKELMVLSMKGLVFLEHDQEYINKVLETKIKNLKLPNILSLKI